MARETRRWATSARAGGAPHAPTAPHGTYAAAGAEPRGRGRGAPKPSGPARFWDGRQVRRALVAAFVVSGLVHGVVTPWRLVSAPDVEFKDVDDELTIPIEMLGDDTPPPKPDPPPQPTTAPTTDPSGPGADAAPPPPKRDAGPASDAGAADDASPLALGDAGVALVSDGGEGEADGGPSDGGEGDSGAIALAEAGAPAAPPNAGGFANIVQGGPVNVDLLVNVDVIRAHPIGKRMGPLLSAIPQWSEFIHGSETGLDPINDTNWIHIYGPSLIHTDRDAVHVHYSAPEAKVDRVLALIAERGDGKGGPYDAGVPGVKATLGYADQASRVILRARPGEVVIVPPAKANDFAKVLKSRVVKPSIRPGEAMRLRVVDPKRQVAIKQLKFPESLKEIRIWIVPRNGDSGADLYGEGDCGDEAGAQEAAEWVKEVVKQTNAARIGVPPFTMSVQSATKNLLDGAVVSTDGNKVRLHLPANKEQLEALLAGAALVLHVDLDKEKP